LLNWFQDLFQVSNSKDTFEKRERKRGGGNSNLSHLPLVSGDFFFFALRGSEKLTFEKDEKKANQSRRLDNQIAHLKRQQRKGVRLNSSTNVSSISLHFRNVFEQQLRITSQFNKF
jgi:hypothetical protein